MSKKAVVFHLGCKVNRYESDRILADLRAAGYEVSETMGYADLYIVNTCAVTAEAERKSRQVLSRFRRFNPDAPIMVTGCAAQKNPAFFENSNVSYLGGTAGKAELARHIGMRYREDLTLPRQYEDSATVARGNRTRSFLKVQDGCDRYCSYCVIPYLRGPSRSRPIANAVEEFERLAESSEEIVITGINLSRYGSDTGESLARLIRALGQFDVRVRLGSFYVEGVDAELLDALFGLKRFCPHFHLSLQHGDDEVLRSMNRKYTAEQYAEKVDLIRSYDRLATMTTDFIVGYPTETEEAFERGKAFLQEIGFADVHIFPFSPREGTAAAKLKTLPQDVVKARVKELEPLKQSLKSRYLQQLIGVRQEVLFEEDKGDGTREGYGRYYVRCRAQTDRNIAWMQATAVNGEILQGEIVYE